MLCLMPKKSLKSDDAAFFVAKSGGVIKESKYLSVKMRQNPGITVDPSFRG